MSFRACVLAALVCWLAPAAAPVSALAADDAAKRPDPTRFLFMTHRAPSLTVTPAPSTPTAGPALTAILKPQGAAVLLADYHYVFNTYVRPDEKLFGVKTTSGWTAFCTQTDKSGFKRMCFIDTTGNHQFDVRCTAQTGEATGVMFMSVGRNGAMAVAPIDFHGYPNWFPLGVELISVCLRITPAPYRDLAEDEWPTLTLKLTAEPVKGGGARLHADVVSPDGSARRWTDFVQEPQSPGAPVAFTLGDYSVVAGAGATGGETLQWSDAAKAGLF
jgi:hypothetical protein